MRQRKLRWPPKRTRKKSIASKQKKQAGAVRQNKTKPMRGLLRMGFIRTRQRNAAGGMFRIALPETGPRQAAAVTEVMWGFGPSYQ